MNRPGFCSRSSKILEGFRDAEMQQYTPEFKDQAVRFVFESIEPDESRKEACRRLASKVNVKEVTLYNWVKAASPVTSNSPGRGGQPDTINDLRAQISGLKKENRELVRANEILKAASAFSGRSSTANQRGDRVRCCFFATHFSIEPICRVLQVAGGTAVRACFGRPIWPARSLMRC